MLLSCLYFLSFVSTPVFGQFECKPIDDCDNLRLLLVREYPDSACQAVGSGSCGNADPFHEVVYRVFLHFETDSSVSDSELYFMLDYSRLNATVNLINTGGEGYSYINKEATKECLKTGSGQWDTDNLVIFEISDNNEVAIEFENETSSPCGPTGAQIQFTPDAPAGVSNCSVTSNCAYAELFPIVVQAYPGETLRLECKVLQYAPSGEIDGCNTSSCALNSGTGNVNTNGISNYTVPSAASPTGENGTLEISFGDTLYNVDGTYDIEVVLNRKDGTGNLDVQYLEFMVEVNSEIAVTGPVFPSSNGPAVLRETACAGNSVSYQLYYVLSPDTAITLAPDDQVVLDIVRIGPPMPFNQIFEMVFKLVNGDASRVRTDDGCSKLNVSSDTVLFVNQAGDPVCGNGELENKLFRVEGREDTSGTCPAPYIRFGLVSIGIPDDVVFDYFECLLLIHSTGPLNVSDVVFPSNWSCENQLVGCDTTCWDLEPGPGTVVHVKMCRDSSIIQFSADSAFMEIHFTGFGCIDGVDIQLLRFNRDEDSSITCVPIINLENQGFPACSPEIKGTITSAITNEPIVDVDVLFLPNHDLICTSVYCPNDTMETNTFGVFAKCGCVRCDTIIIKPQSPSGSDYLNGVSTFDLVLINKHILGIEPFDNLYKIVAADVNNSKSVTTFDIAELRKLILGIYDELPSCSSWEFIPTEFDLSIPLNPLNPTPPESILVTSTTNYDFYAIKIGDVNGSADTSALRYRKQGSTFIEFQTGQLKNDGFFVVPVVYTGTDEVEALQCGIRFDPGKLEFVGATMGDLEGIGAESFGLTHADQGIVKMLWYAGYTSPDPGLKPGTTMFYLTFQSRGSLLENEKHLSLDDAAIENLAWAPNGKEFRIFANQNNSIERSRVSTSTKVLTVEASPNPTSDEVRFLVQSPQQTTARIGMFSAFGQMLWMQSINLPVGETSLETNVLVNQPAGVYLWKVWTPQGAKAEGHLVKQ